MCWPINIDYNKYLRNLEVGISKDVVLMMRGLAKLLTIWMTLLILLGSATALAFQGPTITIIPQSGPVESNFTIDVSGLQPNTTYSVQFVYEPSAAQVFTTERTTDRSGRMVLPITSTPDDEPGNYIVQVRLAGELIIEGRFELTGDASAPQQQPPAAPQPAQPQQPQPQQPPASSGNVTVRIVPASAPIGATYDILVAGLSANQVVTIAVIDPNGVQVYQRQRNADSGGSIDLRIFSERDDSPGTYTVEVRDNFGAVLGNGNFIVEEPIGRNGTVSISPAAGPAGTTYVIDLSNVRPFTDLDVVILPEGEATPVLTTRVRSDVDGRATVSFTSDIASGSGSYSVIVRQDNVDVAQGTLVIGEDGPISPASAVSIEIDPPGAALGSSFNLSISGLLPNSIFTFEIVLDATGEVVYSVSRNADDQGQFSTVLATDPSDVLGAYTLRVLQNAQLISSTGFSILAAGSVNATVTPQTAQVGGAVIITATGLQPGETVIIEILNDNNMIFTRQNVADVNGAIALSYAPASSDAPGEYNVVIRRGTEEVARSVYTLGAATADGIVIDINPQSGPAGTAHTIRVTGLEAGENVTVEVRYAGEVNFSTQRTANINGVLSLELIASATDPEGDYEVSIIRRGETVAQSVLRVGAADVVQPPVQPTPPPAAASDVLVEILPPSGPIGTNHEVRISGLNANEAVEIDVRVGGASVFRTNRTADAQGNTTVVIFSEEGDPIGDYEIVVLRAGQPIGQAILTIEGTTEQARPPASGVAVSITPNSGPIGTTHSIVVTGLQPDELVTIDVALNNRTVFATERGADANGSLQLNLITEQGDMPGVYTVSVLRAGQAIASAPLGIAADIIEGAPEAPQTPEAPEVQPEMAPGEARVLISPQAGPPDTRYDISVEGLTPGETVILELIYDGRSVYNSERSADTQGRVDLSLRSEPTDPAGDYTFNVLRNGSIIASNVLVITGGAAESVVVPSVNVSPEAGPIGTSHAVTVTGLNPGETVTLQVVYDGSVAYTTDRTADETGSLSINLRTEEGDGFGTYSINLLRNGQIIAQGELIVGDAPAQAPPAASIAPSDGEMLAGELSTEGPTASVSFSGEAGEVVYISMTSDEFDAYLILLDAEGNLLSENDDDGLSRNAAIGPFMLPYSGEYEIIGSSYGFEFFSEAELGAYNLRVNRGMPSILAIDQAIEASFAEGTDMRFFTFSAETGDIVSLSVNSDNSIDTVLFISDPDNFTIAFDDDGGGGFDPEINRFVVMQPGEYTVVLRAFTPGETGSASLTLTQEAARSVDSAVQRVRLNNKQLTDSVRMNGASGASVELLLTTVAGTPRDLLITVLQGETVLMSYTAYGIPQEIRVPFLVQTDEPVSIVITDSGVNNSVLDVSVTRLP